MNKRDEAIEAMARAMFARSNGDLYCLPQAWEAYCREEPEYADVFRKDATAAFDAALGVLMEPDAGMCHAGQREGSGQVAMRGDAFTDLGGLGYAPSLRSAIFKPHGERAILQAMLQTLRADG